MGFIPILLTVGGAILLFFMAVNQTLLSKKNAILSLQKTVTEGLATRGAKIDGNPTLDAKVIQEVSRHFQTGKENIGTDASERYQQEVSIPYRDMIVTLQQYNRMVEKRPYSFVAKVMGHRKIAT